jgi:hypothetical protein
MITVARPKLFTLPAPLKVIPIDEPKKAKVRHESGNAYLS